VNNLNNLRHEASTYSRGKKEGISERQVISLQQIVIKRTPETYREE
jgi:hypothetical protein